MISCNVSYCGGKILTPFFLVLYDSVKNIRHQMDALKVFNDEKYVDA